MNILVVGLSHKTAPVEIREKLSVPQEKMEKALARLCSYPHIEEAAILSTCNRLEIYITGAQMEQANREVTQFLFDYSNISDFHYLFEHLFFIRQQDVVKHLMEVASGLDSLVVGEGQILAQVKHAYQLGQQYGSIKRTLNHLFKQAITTAKKVRTEIAICQGAVSVSSAAVELADIKLENLSEYRTTIVGAGKMARRLVQHLLGKGVTQIAIVNRSIERAQQLANQFEDTQIQCYALKELISVVADSDIVFTSTASTKTLLDRAKLEIALKSDRSLMLFDISVPRNVDPDVNQLDSVQVFNVDHLEAVVAKNQENRRQMAQEAQMLIFEGIKEFNDWWRALEVVPTICCLRDKIEKIREQELEKALSRFGSEFSPKHQKTVESLTRGIVNKILHEPMTQIRAQRDVETQRLVLQALQVLFQLDTKKQQFASILKTSAKN